MINAYWEDLVFAIQEGQSGVWRRVADTALPSPQDASAPDEEVVVGEARYRVQSRSIVVLRAPAQANALPQR